MEHEYYMALAVEEARLSLASGDVPVGCIITGPDGDIIGRGHNTREAQADATAHAEMIAIRTACKTLGTWRLQGCSLYVTLEPCPMCAGAIINARIDKLFYGAKEPNTGSCGSVINLFMENYGHHTAIFGGILESDCAGLLRLFFSDVRRTRG